jgi:hypothetical protein
MPCAAATNGTLSTMAERNPIMIVMILILPIDLSNEPASDVRIPVDCNAETANKIPRKNKILGVSIFRNA